jgi:hypothetical protein
MILKEREDILSMLSNAFNVEGLEPYICITSFPETKDAMESMQIRAKSYSKGCIYVTWTAERPGQRVGVIYPHFIDIFTVFLFSNKRESDEDIINHYEIARDTLQKKYFLYYGEMSPVKTDKTGLYMAALQIGTQDIYQGVS